MPGGDRSQPECLDPWSCLVVPILHGPDFQPVRSFQPLLEQVAGAVWTLPLACTPGQLQTWTGGGRGSGLETPRDSTPERPGLGKQVFPTPSQHQVLTSAPRIPAHWPQQPGPSEVCFCGSSSKESELPLPVAFTAATRPSQSSHPVREEASVAALRQVPSWAGLQPAGWVWPGRSPQGPSLAEACPCGLGL